MNQVSVPALSPPLGGGSTSMQSSDTNPKIVRIPHTILLVVPGWARGYNLTKGQGCFCGGTWIGGSSV